MRLVEGWTADVDFTVLDSNGANFPWAGATVALIIKDRDGVEPSLGTLATPSDGIARWSPATVAAGGLVQARSPYYLHLKITKSGKDSYVPDGGGLPIIVTAPGRP